MAYDDSGAIAPESSYTLGSYTFTLQNVISEDERVVQAHMSGPEGPKAQGISFPPSAIVKSWSVEANETEASVYVDIDGDDEHIVPNVEVGVGSVPFIYKGNPCSIDQIEGGDSPIYACCYQALDNVRGLCLASLSYFRVLIAGTGYAGWLRGNQVSYKGKSYYVTGTYGAAGDYFYNVPYTDLSNTTEIGYYILFQPAVKSGEYLVARFAIDLQDADPESWDEPPSDGDPELVLNVTVTGATAGQGSGVPLTPEKAQIYGCGGTGGNGGGGGGGASTVIIYQFATDKAGQVEQTAISRGPGTGGPGGKGGDGADGCIMILY